MKRSLTAFISLLLAAAGLVSCSVGGGRPNDAIEFYTPAPTAAEAENVDYDALEIDPAAQQSGRVEVVGGTGFEAENGARLLYSGGEMELELEFADQIFPWEYGLAVALNGIFQPSRCTPEGGEESEGVMHIVRLAPNTTRRVRFVFTPNTGKSGDLLPLEVVMVNCPSYRAEFNGSTSAAYGFAMGSVAHRATSCGISLKMEADAPIAALGGGAEIEVFPVPSEYIEAREEYLLSTASEERAEARTAYSRRIMRSSAKGRSTA